MPCNFLSSKCGMYAVRNELLAPGVCVLATAAMYMHKWLLAYLLDLIRDMFFIDLLICLFPCNFAGGYVFRLH